MLSIVIPIYNGKKYIPKLLDCFLSQIGYDFELVFVDDGSTDGTYESLKTLHDIDLANRNNSINIQVIHQENAGVSAARNTGIAACKGDYITFVDVDDMISDNYFEEIFKGIKASPDLFVFQSAHVLENESPDTVAGNVKNKNISNIDIIKLMLSNPTNFGVYNLVINKKFLGKSNAHFPVGYKYYEDYFYIYSLFCLARNIVYTDKQLYYYIKRPGSAMQKFTKDRIECIELIESLYPLVEKTVPSIHELFENIAVARIYWSILWQAALAFKSYRDFKKFYKSTNAAVHLKGLNTFPDKKVRMSSALFDFNPRLYYIAVNIIGRSHSKVEKIRYSEYK